jgi:hypothetical protein
LFVSARTSGSFKVFTKASLRELVGSVGEDQVFILAVPHVYEISYIGGVHVKAGVMALCVTFGLLHKNSPRRF